MTAKQLFDEFLRFVAADGANGEVHAGNLLSGTHALHAGNLEHVQRHLWRYADAAKFLGISRGTLRGLVARRQIPHHRVSRRIVLFDPDVLRRWLKAHAVGTKQNERHALAGEALEGDGDDSTKPRKGR